ncbi:MAG: hypothetical protein KGJ53_15460 [Alphaproteobacteria bacterium]|nr:hypothetical protein [Alphaproteobacteria bacterium]
MRKGMIVLGIAALLCTQAAFADRLVPEFKLTKANATAAEFQQDRDACVKEATVQKWLTTPDNRDSPFVTHDVIKFARCMSKKGYYSDRNGYDTGRLWEGAY